MPTVLVNDPLTNEEREEKQRLDVVIDENLNAFAEVIRALAVYRDKRLYREEFPSFTAYLRAKHKKINSRQRADQLITHVAIVDELSTVVDIIPPEHERQSRELARLDDPVARRAAWLRAQVVSGQDQPDSTWVKASVNVVEMARVTGGYVDIGAEGGDLVAFNAAVAKDAAENMQRQIQHVHDSLNKKAGMSAYPEALLDKSGKAAELLKEIEAKLKALPGDCVVRVRITK
jgi:hypothetical protein